MILVQVTVCTAASAKWHSMLVMDQGHVPEWVEAVRGPQMKRFHFHLVDRLWVTHGPNWAAGNASDIGEIQIRWEISSRTALSVLFAALSETV